MAYNSEKRVTPTLEAGLGLIYRLNDLWREADRHCLNGEFEKWNFVLDRLYSNLMYRKKASLIKDNTGNIVDVRILGQESQAHKVFRTKLSKIRSMTIMARRKRNRELFLQAKSLHYKTLMEKDVWLRSYMAELGLYLKEVDYDPAKALFGG